MKTDYSDLKGKVFTVIDFNGGSHEAIVVNAHYQKGITAIYAEKPDVKCICLNKEIHGDGTGTGILTYKQAFFDSIKRIKSGVYDISEARKARRHGINGGGNQNCAFS